MMNEVLIVKNITREGPGILEEELRARGVAYTVIDLDSGQNLPKGKDFGAIIVLGGPDSANDQNEKIMGELAYIREQLAQGTPYLGICLGLQLLVKAAGGNVVMSPVKEIGFMDPEGGRFQVELTEAGGESPLFEGLSTTFSVFHLHGETVELTEDMKLLATGQFCRNQIVLVGKSAFGIQCHFELTPSMFETWVQEDEDLMKLDGDKLRKEFADIQEEYQQVGQKLFSNFLNIAGF